ncbi:MAG: four helix bundle protein [Moorea sp. SIO3G5]|nr:four helix bundle protein [Moorena sp. SIO3G5]
MPTIICKVSCCGGQKHLYISVPLLMLGILPTLQTFTNGSDSQAAQSTVDFVHKLEIALKEARETRYWLRLLIAVALFPESRLRPLLNESEELIKILASIVVKTKRNRANNKL